MAKGSFTAPSYATNNVQSQPDQPTISASALKLVFDQVGIDTKTFLTDDLIDELNASAGSNKVGHTSASITADNVQEALEENRVAIDATEADITTLDGEVVKLTGNQTVAGIKTFTSSPVVPTPTADTHAATKKYVDDGLDLKANDNEVVKLTGNQSIDNTKTFTSNIVVPATPTTSTHATSKGYVDALDAQNVKLTGAQTINGAKDFVDPVGVATGVDNDHALQKTQVESLIDDAMIGELPDGSFQLVEDIIESVFDTGKTYTDVVQGLAKSVKAYGLTVAQLLDNSSDFASWTTAEFTTESGFQVYTADGAANIDGICPTLLTDSTQYTLIGYVLENDLSTSFAALRGSDLDTTGKSYAAGFTGLDKYLFTTGTIATNQLVQFARSTSLAGEKIKLKSIILEGDWTSVSDDLLKEIVLSADFGIQSVENPVVESVGVNLYPSFNYETGIFSTADGSKTTNDAFARTAESITIESSTEYSITALSTDRIFFYDHSGAFISYTDNSTFTTPDNAKSMNHQWNKDVAGYPDVMMNNGASVSTYEPHKSSELTGLTTLRSVPNGTRDEAELVGEPTGPRYKTERIDEYVIDGNLVSSYNSGQGANSDLSRVSYTISTEYLKELDAGIGFNGLKTFRCYVNSGDIQTECAFIHSSSVLLLIYVPTVDLPTADLSGFQQYLNDDPLTILSEFETPVLEEIGVTGTYEAFANGTTYNSSDTFFAELDVDYGVNAAAQISRNTREVTRLSGDMGGVIFRNNAGSPELSLDGGGTWLTITTS